MCRKDKKRIWRLHCNENPIYVFLFWDCVASVQFPHSCVCERFIYFSGSVHIFGCSKIDRSWKYINLSQIDECRNWETEHYNTVLEIKRDAKFHF